MAILLAAGDVAVPGRGDAELTAKLLDREPTARILALGDLAYGEGSIDEYLANYEPTWGRHRERTLPTPGNHEYMTPGAAGYFSYWHEQRAPGWYSVPLGPWLLVALNSADVATTAEDGPQAHWLREELKRHPHRRILAFCHHPRYSSGPHGNQEHLRGLCGILFRAGCEILVAGHDHVYERFKPQDNDERESYPWGMAQFVVGTGGAGCYPVNVPRKGSAFIATDSYGVLKLELLRNTYSWGFFTTDGRVLDKGTARTHGRRA